MKKILSGIFSLFLIVGAINAQVEDPAKALKKVRTLLAAYNTSPSENDAKLDEAKEKVDYAMEDAAIQETFKGWSTKAKVYNEVTNRDVNNFLIASGTGEAYAFKNPGSALTALEAYKMALGKAEKKYEKKEMLKGIQDIANLLSNIGNKYTNDKNYSNAYKSLDAILEIREVLRENGIETILNTQEELNDHSFVVGYCAMVSDVKDRALEIFQDLISKNYEEPRLYAFVFNMIRDTDEDTALKVLSEGRTKYPEDKEIMFAEINYYIAKEDYVTLKAKLEKAIEADPGNPSVYSALGNVYMNLFQQEYSAGNHVLSQQYFDESKKYYQQALQLDDSLFDVQYSIGSLYYNKAVEITKTMNDLPVSEAKKYDLLSQEAKDLFTTGLPFFKKAESINPNDVNTLIALKEIFARLDDFEKSGEFKKRLEVVQTGGTNASSFFE